MEGGWAASVSSTPALAKEVKAGVLGGLLAHQAPHCQEGGQGWADTGLAQLGRKPVTQSLCPTCGKPQSNQGLLALLTHKA